MNNMSFINRFMIVFLFDYSLKQIHFKFVYFNANFITEINVYIYTYYTVL